MLIHTVFFYLKPETTDETRAEFSREVTKLAGIPSLSGFYAGRPAPVPDRPVLDSSYDFSITCLFADVEALTAYQKHAVHQAFLDYGILRWTRLQVYDAQG